ncbi:MAG: restriction endonuclease [Candidatus Bathyarchaeota archaeon]|nr:restriction endonuclease [Candidatus Bathyarchaeota archaeon]
MSSGGNEERARIFVNEDLEHCDLIVDAIYKGGRSGNARDDPIHKMLGCGVQGGFRYRGSHAKPTVLVLYTSLEEPDWPDYLDIYTGKFTYHGDNRRPGHELHDTHKKGNLILERCFEQTHKSERSGIPPIFVFAKGGIGRDVIFKGLAVPGCEDLTEDEDLVAIWKSKRFERFQNYRAMFTILDVSKVSRSWLNDVRKGVPLSPNAPESWSEWIQAGKYSPLKAERIRQHRTKYEQLPHREDELGLLKTVFDHFPNPHAFEKCAAELLMLMDAHVISYDVTRPWRDGGRDAIGKYRIGSRDSAIHVEFALEAKHNALKNGVGIRGTSRLISRLKHRQFGVLVTTSYVGTQAYEEIIEDQHPVIVVSAIDIVGILRSKGLTTPGNVSQWLEALDL